MNESNHTINSDKLTQLQLTLEQLSARVASQEEELSRLSTQLKSQREVNYSARQVQEPPTSRRHMLKKLGAAAAGLAIAGTAAVASETQTAQAAADLSGGNTVTATAIVRPSQAITLPTMRVDADQTASVLNVTTQSAALLATANNPDTSTSRDFGIVAVAGPSDVFASDLTIAGPVGPGFTPRSAAIQARSGTSNPATGNGNLGVHAISDAQVGVVGQYQGISTVANNYLITDGTDFIASGVIGASDNGVGVIGASNAYSGVYAASTSTSGYSLIACRGPHDNNGALINDPNRFNLAPLYIEPSTVAGAPGGTGHRKGELHVDSDGKLWICANDGVAAPPSSTRVPPELRRTLAGATAGGTFYQLSSVVILPTPLRILGPYNTINTNYAQVSTTVSYFKIEGSWTNANPSPYPTVTDTIPSTASAVFANVSVILPGQSGYLTIWPADVSQPITLNLGYTAGGFVVSSTSLIRLGAIPTGPNAGKKGIAVYAQTPCQITFDVVAYII